MRKSLYLASERLVCHVCFSHGKSHTEFYFLFFYYIYLFYLFISCVFLAVLGLGCGMWGLRWGVCDLSMRHRLFVVVHRLPSSCGVWIFSLSSCGVRAPGCVGSVVCDMWALLLRRMSSVVVPRGLSCPTACGILVPRPGIEPASPALEGMFFTTGPPGKSPEF